MAGNIRALTGLLLIASLIMAGCGSSQEATVEQRNKELVRRMNDEVWNKGILDNLDDMFAKDVVWHFVPDGSELTGIDELRQEIRSHREAFPDWAEEITHLVAEGEYLAIQFTSTGTNNGSFLGNPPTGKRIHITEMCMLRIVDGKIAEVWLLLIEKQNL